MSREEEPLEPDFVIDSTKRTPTQRARSAAGRAYGAASSGVRNVREAAKGSRLIEATEAGVNKALGNVSHAIDEAVRSGRVERAFDKAQETVTTGADGVRRLIDRVSKKDPRDPDPR
ncbi:hypothetical protein [Brevibacterium casei]